MGDKYTCPNCHNPDCEEDHDYCWNCGIELGNYCTNKDCPQLGASDEDEYVVALPDRFTYCPYCGEKSHYAQAGYITPLEFEV